MADVLAAKRALSEVLGKKWDEYWTLLRRWFRRQITKQQLDNSVRALLHTHVSLHTAFMLSILRHCQGSTNGLSVAMTSSARSTSSVSRPRSKSAKSVGAASAAGGSQTAAERSSTSGQAAPPPASKPSPAADATVAKKPAEAGVRRGKFVRYAPYPLQDFSKNVKRDSERLVQADDTSWKPSRQPYLPTAAGLKSRLEAHALSAGLESVDGEVPRLLLYAVEHHIKNIISAASVQSQVTVPAELVDHDYALRPPLLAPDSHNGARGEIRRPNPAQSHRPSTMLSGSEKSAICRGRAPIITASQQNRSSSGGGGGSQDRRIGVPIGRITTMSVHNAVQANKSMFGGRSVSQPLIHRLQALL